MRPSDPMPPNTYDKPTKGWLYRPSSEYAWYLDLLRNEEPVWAHIEESSPYDHCLTSEQETVGEGELAEPL